MNENLQPRVCRLLVKFSLKQAKHRIAHQFRYLHRFAMLEMYEWLGPTDLSLREVIPCEQSAQAQMF